MSYDWKEMGGVPISSINIDAGQKGLFTVIVTPDDIPGLLDRNKHNRKLNKFTVDRYAHEMSIGEWDWCEGDDTKLLFGANGELMNGQHHLHAQLKAGVIGAYDMRTGVPRDSFKHMDSGAKRRVADYFAGKELPGDVSSISKAALAFSYGRTHWTGGYFGLVITRKMEHDFAEENYSEFVDFARLAKRIRGQHCKGSVAAIGAALWMLADRDGIEKINQFVDEYVDGQDNVGKTKYVIQRKITAYKGSIPANWWSGVTILAYNAWAEGRPLRRINANDVEKALKSEVALFSSLDDESESCNETINPSGGA